MTTLHDYWKEHHANESQLDLFKKLYDDSAELYEKQFALIWNHAYHLYDKCPPFSQQSPVCRKCLVDRLIWEVPQDKPEYLYHLLNKDGQLIYVGISKTPLERFMKHVTEKPGVSRMVVKEWFRTRIECERKEAQEIRRLKPRLNIQYV